MSVFLFMRLMGESPPLFFVSGFAFAASSNSSIFLLAQPVGERLAQRLEYDREVCASAWFLDHWMQHANEAQMVSYFGRLKLYGEPAALQWAKAPRASLRRRGT